MKPSIKKKLASGFGFCVLLMIAVVGFNFSAIRKLDGLHHGTLKRSVDMELSTDAQHIGEDMYMIIANAVINRDLATSERLWAQGKKENLAKLEKVAAAADTPEELSKIRVAREAFADIVRIYEREMLPLIRDGARDSASLADIDAQIDRRIETIDSALQSVARSMSDENQKVSIEFHSVMANVFGFGLLVSLAGVVFSVAISARTTRSIVHPLMEMTLAAQEMEKGNYPVELKHNSDDEIGTLAKAFGSMAEQVAKRTAELQGSNERLKHEINERVFAEEQMWRMNTRLENLVTERTAELRGENQELRQLIAVNEEAQSKDSSA